MGRIANGFKVVCEHCGSERVAVHHVDDPGKGTCGDQFACEQCGNRGEHVHHAGLHHNPVTR